MTDQPPLNPDALESGAKALFLRERKNHTPSIECPEPPNWEDLTETSMEHYRGNARTVLAVAQPVVNSVEELDALPQETVIRSVIFGVVRERMDSGWLATGADEFESTDEIAGRDHVVLHRPVVNDA